MRGLALVGPASSRAIGLGSDHHGFRLKHWLSTHLAGRGEEVLDFGCFSEEPVDYPDVALVVARAVQAGSVTRGILVCRTGVGMAIAANKLAGVYAAPMADPAAARRAREHNNVNVIALGADIVTPEGAAAIVEVWLAAEFRGGESARKLSKIRRIERGCRTAAPGKERGHGCGAGVGCGIPSGLDPVRLPVRPRGHRA